jgi:VWFA-related protein
MNALPQFCWRRLYILSLLAACAFGQASDDPLSNWKISLDVEQVLLTVSVRDRAGRHVPQLTESAFRVDEDGKQQRIEYFSREDIPVTVGLLIDNSRSMRNKHREVLTAAVAFIQQSNPEDEMFVVNFNEQPRFGLPDSLDFAASPEVLKRALASVELDGQTALYDAIDEGMDHLDRGKWEKDVLLVVSDGGDNASKMEFRDLLARVERSTALIYTIGIYDDGNEDRNPGVLKEIARASGAGAFFPTQIQDVISICEEIANDIRSQYTIAYKSANSSGGSYRKLRVTAKSPHGKNLVVRARSGYYASQHKP